MKNNNRCLLLRAVRNTIVISAVFCLKSLAANAATIVQIPLSSWAMQGGNYTSFSFEAEYLQQPASQGIYPIPNTKIFDAILITPNDVGRNYTLSSDTDDPQFTGFVAQLTNGIDDPFIFWYLTGGSGPGYGQQESTAFASVLKPGEVDLSHYRIDSVTVHVDTLSMIWSNDQFPCRTSSGCTETTFSGTLTINGTVLPAPIPAAFWLFGSGWIGLFRLLQKHQRITI